MSRRLRILGYALRRAFLSFRKRAAVSCLTVCVMTIALVLVGLTHLVERNLGVLGKRWGAGVQMIVYLDEGTSEEHAFRLRDALVALEAVYQADYIPPEEALVQLRKSLGEDEELLQGIEASYLPASIEVSLVEGVRDLVSVQPVIERLEATRGVEDVSFLGTWVEDFTALLHKVQRASLWVALFASLVGVFTVVATMRISASSRSAELRVLQLMGAPTTMRAGPTLFEGATLGLVASCIAICLLWALFQNLAPLVVSALQSSVGSLDLAFLGVRDLVQLCVFGVSLGLVGGLVTNYSQGQLR